jgi:hypothetical protein
MKNENLLLLLFILIVITGSSNLIAQSSYSTTNDSEGIYLTYEDFETGELTKIDLSHIREVIPYGHRDFSRIKTLN